MRSRSHCNPHPAGAAPAPTALLLSAALLLGGLALHPHAADHPVRQAAGEGPSIFPDAAHPQQPPHVEAAGDPRHTRCQACVLSLQSRALEAGSPPVPVPPSTGTLLARGLRGPLLDRGALPGRGRAPPRA